MTDNNELGGMVWDQTDSAARHFLAADALAASLAGEGASSFSATDPNQNLWGTDGEDVLVGGSGSDILYALDGNDILHGGAGDDDLYGGDGDDVYLFGRGDGNDFIIETETRADRRNVIRLGEGIAVSDIEFIRDGNSLIIRIVDTGETLTVSGGFASNTTNINNSRSIQAVEFSDDTVWEWSDILQQGIRLADGAISGDIGCEGGTLIAGGAAGATLYGGDGADTLIGNDGNDDLVAYAGDDILDGRGGDDWLSGGDGDDTYLYGRGYGHDVIIEQETRADRRNVIRLGAGLTLDNIEFLLKPVQGGVASFIIRIIDTGETLTVAGGMSTGLVTNLEHSGSIQAIEFDDGSVMEWADILRHGFRVHESSTIAQLGSEGGRLFARDGVDCALVGGGGNDILVGGDGNDSITSDVGDDILIGGAGDDHLWGGFGDDTYLFGRGDGHDVVIDGGGNDTVIFGSGIQYSNLWFRQDGVNLVIDVLGSNDSVTLSSYYDRDDLDGSSKIENIVAGGMRFASGQLDQMIQAVAAFGVEQGFDGQWTQEQKEQATTAVLSTYWHAVRQ